MMYYIVEVHLMIKHQLKIQKSAYNLLPAHVQDGYISRWMTIQLFTGEEFLRNQLQENINKPNWNIPGLLA